MNFDIASCLIGLVIGIVVASLVKLHALKQLKMNLDAIGVNLGIEGFEPKDRPGASQTIGPVSGQGNRINQAGRDINNTSLYKTVKAALEGGRSGAAGIRQTRRFSFRWESKDRRFVDQLKNLSRQRNDDWTQQWIEACVANQECQTLIREEIQKCRSAGWEPVLIGFDNHGDGVHVNLECERSFDV